MSDPSTPSLEDIEAQERSDFESSFFEAIESRFPVNPDADKTEATKTAKAARASTSTSTSTGPSGTPDSGGPEGEGAPVEGQEPSSPESTTTTTTTTGTTGTTIASPAPGTSASLPDEAGGALSEGSEAPGGEHGQSPSVFTLSGGNQVTEDQVNQALQVHNYFARLDPRQVQAIDALMSGQYRLIPNGPGPGQATTTESGAQPVQPVISSGQTPPLSDADGGEWLDPKAQTEVHRLRAELEALKKGVNDTLTPVVSKQQSTEYNERLETINQVADAFQSHYGLDDPTMRGLEQAIVDAQVLPSLQARYGNVRDGMAAALEMYLWSTPALRQAQITKSTAAQAATQSLDDQASLRKQQLTALSASGGSAPRREPVPSTVEDRHQAIVQEIAQAMNGSGTIE